MPDCKLSDYLANANIKELDARNFADEEVWEILVEDLESLSKSAVELRNASDAEGWFSAVSLLEGHVEYYNKQLWFLKSILGK